MKTASEGRNSIKTTPVKTDDMEIKPSWLSDIELGKLIDEARNGEPVDGGKSKESTYKSIGQGFS